MSASSSLPDAIERYFRIRGSCWVLCGGPSLPNKMTDEEGAMLLADLNTDLRYQIKLSLNRVNGSAINGSAINGSANNGSAINSSANNGSANNGSAVNGLEESDTPEDDPIRFAYKVMDHMINCGWKLQADLIMEHIGQTGIKGYSSRLLYSSL